MAFKLTAGQRKAILMALSWYFTQSYDKQLLAVSGLAGSGKSTVVKQITEALGLMHSNILYTALTGKAVSVLRMKGHMSNTIHKTFYNPISLGGRVFFNRKARIPSNLELIVVDEFGMVGDSIIEDILSFGIPVIGLGDHGQLPPLFEKNSFMTDETLDIFLDEVMRTDDTSGILTLAMQARRGEELIPGTYGMSRVIDKKEDLKKFSEYDVVLCWTNKTRKYLNSIIRKELGIKSNYPTKGEPIYFLENRYDKMIEHNNIDTFIVNGLECEVVEDSEVIDEHTIRVKARPKFIDDPTKFFDVVCSRGVFDGYHNDSIPTAQNLMAAERSNLEEGADKMVFCDFAHALSVHASQGSEWGNVLIIKEMPIYRPEFKQWFYTALTRGIFSIDVLINQYT